MACTIVKFKLPTVTYQIRIDEEIFQNLKRQVTVRNEESKLYAGAKTTISGLSAWYVADGLRRSMRGEELDEQSEGAL